MTFRENWTSARDGLRLYWREYGDTASLRTPLLCLPGLTRNSKDFHDLAQRYCGQRRVICLDYRGRGRSEYDSDWRNYDPQVYLEDIRHILAATGAWKVVTVGTSMGGILSMALTVMMPTLLAGAVLNDVGPELAGPGLDRILDTIGHDHPQPDWETAVRYLRRTFPILTLKTDERWMTMARNTYRQGADGLLHFDWDVTLAHNLTRGRLRIPDLWPLFRALRGIPVLALRGSRSDVLSVETFDRMAEEKPDLLRVTVPGCGHCPVLDEPEVLEMLDVFLARL
ncbi:MAG: alpha/beta hydrolase [Rhodospirillales bacterium]|nr:alpha/beta hydrolase [Rhodospirillales bacterium]